MGCHISKGRKGHILPFFHLRDHLLQNCLITFSLFWHEASKEGANELPKDGFYLIEIKVNFQGLKKVKFVYFDIFWKVSQKRSDNFLYVVYAASWG